MDAGWGLVVIVDCDSHKELPKDLLDRMTLRVASWKANRLGDSDWFVTAVLGCDTT